jgi:hypothetical protein
MVPLWSQTGSSNWVLLTCISILIVVGVLPVIVGSLRWEPTTERSLLVGESKWNYEASETIKPSKIIYFHHSIIINPSKSSLYLLGNSVVECSHAYFPHLIISTQYFKCMRTSNVNQVIAKHALQTWFSSSPRSRSSHHFL